MSNPGNMFRALRAENAKLRARVEELEKVLRECADTMAFAYIFVVSKERTKKPEGSALYKEALNKARQALSGQEADDDPGRPLPPHGSGP